MRDRLLVGAGMLLVVLVGAWIMLGAYQTEAAKGCLDLYRAARTAADTATVDTMIPDGGPRKRPEAHSCGFMRRTARWHVARLLDTP